jgi:hypothetical protein
VRYISAVSALECAWSGCFCGILNSLLYVYQKLFTYNIIYNVPIAMTLQNSDMHVTSKYYITA